MVVAHANKNADGKRTNTDTVALFQSETLPLNSFRSLDYARGNESIIYFTDLCKPKNTFASYPAAKHPNAINLRLQIYDKRSVNF